MNKNKKWQEYIEKNMKELQKCKEIDIHEDLVNFIETCEELFSIGEDSSLSNGNCDESISASPFSVGNTKVLEEVVLKSGSYTKLYEKRMRQKILISKLVDDIYGT